jgi:hypothetical protein
MATTGSWLIMGSAYHLLTYVPRVDRALMGRL